ncbi:MAG: hypothetical protein N4A50_07480 [Vallitalea sp.]|jgi:hypothetical protein|nr:hypothetical protein [Vallitalea sp.]
MCYSIIVLYIYKENKLLTLIGNPFTVYIYIIIILQHENKRFSKFIKIHYKKVWEEAKTWGVGNRIKWSWAFNRKDVGNTAISDIKEAYIKTILTIYILGILTFPLFGIVGILLNK